MATSSTTASSGEAAAAPAAATTAVPAAAGSGVGGDVGGTPAPPRCAGVDCDKPARLQCPTCKADGIPGGIFCTKECFQRSWEEHKLYHKAWKALATGAAAAPSAAAAAAPAMSVAALSAEVAASAARIVAGPAPVAPPLSKAFASYRFTGALRPWTVTPQVAIPAASGIRKPDYSETGVPRSELAERGGTIAVYRGAEVDAARLAGRLGREVLDIAASVLRPGVTGDDIDRIVYAACLERGVYPSPLNYSNFPKSLCVSVNEVICHGIPDTRPLVDGDIVNLDVSIYTADGFHTDLNETYCVGAVDEAGRRLVQCAYECLAAAVAVCKPGVLYRDLGGVITRKAGEYGFSVNKTYCGHGVGKLFHTSPNVPHYAKNKAVGIMRAGHMFTIEPMINEGTASDEHWPDKWTAVTRDGKRSAQFEHTLLVTETGVEILTARPGASRTAMVWDAAAIARPLAADTAAAGAGAAAVPASVPAAGGAGSVAAADVSGGDRGIGDGGSAGEGSAAGGGGAATA